MNTALLLTSFLSGVLTILAPCVLPLLPVIIGTTAGSKDLRKPFIISASLGASIILFTLLLKATTLLISVPQSFWDFVSGGIVTLFGVFLLFPAIWDKISLVIGLENKSQSWLHKSGEKDSIWGSVLIGAALGPVFSSCSPTYFLILATVLPASLFAAILYLFSYALGLALVFGLVGYFGQKIIIKLRWAANPNGIFKKTMGVLLIIVGLFVITGYYKVIEAKLLDSGFNGGNLETYLFGDNKNKNSESQVELTGYKNYKDYSLDEVTKAKVDGKNYALFFHADWCSTCKNLDSSIIENLDKLPENSIILKVDYDNASDVRQKHLVLTQSTVLFFDFNGNLVDRKINPTIDRIIKGLNKDKQKTMEQNINPEISSFIKNIKSKKKEFNTAKEYYLYLLGQKELKQATFAGGCFWCMEGPFEAENGVIETFSGYAGSNKENPSYEEVSNGSAIAREGIEIFYEPRVITYDKLLEIFWRQIDPADEGGQFGDRGFHYTTAIYYHNEKQKEDAIKSKQTLEDSKEFPSVATKIEPFENFYLAEEYHQDYYIKSSSHYDAYKVGSGRAKNIKENSKSFDKIFQKRDLKNNYKRPDESKIKSMLNQKSYDITQKGSTEKPFDNEFWDHKEPGIYVDIVTGEPLFSSTDKFDSGTGWPSFTKPIDDNFVTENEDNSFFMTRTEIKSKIGKSHLGHVFNDGPKEKGGMRYCINSAALRFVPLDKLEEEGYGKYLPLFTNTDSK